MAYDFYIVDGKKPINYKPTVEHYERAFVRYCHKFLKDSDTFYDTKDKALFLLIRLIGRDKRKIEQMSDDEVYSLFRNMQLVNNLIGEYTPKELVNLFPIDKDYSGGDCWKDYFYCTDYIKKFGIDRKIGDSAIEFLMEYQNMDISLYILAVMRVVSAISLIENGTDPFIEAMEEMGVHPKTMYKEGNEMVDSETGERYKIAKPKNPMRKIFTIIKGGNDYE